VLARSAHDAGHGIDGVGNACPRAGLTVHRLPIGRHGTNSSTGERCTLHGVARIRPPNDARLRIPCTDNSGDQAVRQTRRVLSLTVDAGIVGGYARDTGDVISRAQHAAKTRIAIVYNLWP
jgi:hypothetical protein